MRALEFLGGLVIAIISVFILLAGMIFAFGSIGRYMKAKAM